MGQFSINQKNRSELVSSIFTKTGRFLSICNPWWVQVQLSSSAHGVFAYQNHFRFVPEYVENDWTLKQITFFCTGSLNSNINENHSVIMKSDKTGSVRSGFFSSPKTDRLQFKIFKF
jgi:hypothetical protein